MLNRALSCLSGIALTGDDGKALAGGAGADGGAAGGAALSNDAAASMVFAATLPFLLLS